MATVKDILKNKRHEIFSVKSTDAVTLALQIMKEHRVRSLISIHIEYQESSTKNQCLDCRFS